MARTFILLLAITTGACAARGGVPRPFPGAPIPPGAGEAPTERAEAPAERAETPTEQPEEALPAVPPAAATPTATVAPGLLGDVIRSALTFVGVPYRNGGSDPSGFDCSGFMQYIFGMYGTALPREVRDQYRLGRDIDLKDVRPGDLLFFETVSRGASHVGMALGEGRFVHAPSSRGVVRVEPYTAAYWARRFIGARRLTEVSAPPVPAPFPGAVRSSR